MILPRNRNWHVHSHLTGFCLISQTPLWLCELSFIFNLACGTEKFFSRNFYALLLCSLRTASSWVPCGLMLHSQTNVFDRVLIALPLHSSSDCSEALACCSIILGTEMFDSCVQSSNCMGLLWEHLRCLQLQKIISLVWLRIQIFNLDELITLICSGK